MHMAEPIIGRDDAHDPEHEALLADSVGVALFVVLETLAPAERLAFVLPRPARPDRARRLNRSRRGQASGFSSRSFTAGPWITRPVWSKREPWQGQSQDRSAWFHFTWQPRCVHTADTWCSLPPGSR